MVIAMVIGTATAAIGTKGTGTAVDVDTGMGMGTAVTAITAGTVDAQRRACA